MDVIYFVLTGKGEYMRIFDVTDNAERAREIAQNVYGVAIGFPINYFIADFREQANE